MRVMHATGPRRVRFRLVAEDGFTMVFALLVLLVTSVLTAAVFLAVQNDATLTGADLAGKRAYAAAQAGVQTYVYNLNSNSANSAWWETCSDDTSPNYPTPVAVSTNAGYTYTPVVNGGGTCSVSDPVGSLIDSAGNLRIAVTGISGSATRTIVASLRTLTPLSYLWYTVHETLDPAADSACQGDPFYYQPGGSSIPAECQINWITGDKVNGPLYTQDQLLIGSGASPSFGAVTSEAPSTNGNAVCVGSNCQNATFSSPPQTVLGGAQKVSLPPQNGSLETDAQKYGKVYTGTTAITLNGTTAKVVNCPTASTCTTTSALNLTQTPIIYVANDTSQSTACNTSYSPQSGISYPTTPSGPCGDIYVTGTYSVPVTLASQNDIIVEPGSVGGVINSTDTSPTGTAALTGTATLGLVADEYVRVYHPQSGGSNCSASNPPVTIDGAILTLQGSFMVDNYTCGGSFGTLTVHGAIAQEYRGAVGTSAPSGYLKNYNYDSRLSEILPPYLFDLQTTGWTVLRETLCSRTGGGCSGT
jgi:hypothetical protein